MSGGYTPRGLTGSYSTSPNNYDLGAPSSPSPTEKSGGGGMDPYSAGIMAGGSFLNNYLQQRAAEEAQKRALASQTELAKGQNEMQYGQNQSQVFQNLMSAYRSALS